MTKIKDFENILQLAPDAIIIVDSTGSIIYTNLQAEKVFEYKGEEILDKHVEILIPEIFVNYKEGNYNHFIKREIQTDGISSKLYGKKKDNSVFPIEISLSPVKQEGLLVIAIRDISEKVKLNERFENLLELAPDAIIIVNKTGTIELVNLQAEKMFGYSKKELIGQKVEKLMPNRFRDIHNSHRTTFFSNPHWRPMGSGLKLFGKRKDNTEFPIEISLSPIEKEGLVAAAVRDVTEKFLNDYLINKTKQLEDFAYITSHNLRSPVLNLALLLNFYKSEETEEGKQILLDKFEQTVEKLSETLNNLMDVLIIQQDSNKVKSKLKFETIFNKIKLDLDSFIAESNAEIIADFNEAPEIEFSKIYLESIMQNLLSNSIKYSSPERSPLIHIKSKYVEDKIHLTFSDNGLGIDLKKYGSKIFGLNKIFHKHPNAKGVGLFITKAQIDSMGGQIFVSSEINKGTTFTIIF